MGRKFPCWSSLAESCEVGLTFPGFHTSSPGTPTDSDSPCRGVSSSAAYPGVTWAKSLPLFEAGLPHL